MGSDIILILIIGIVQANALIRRKKYIPYQPTFNNLTKPTIVLKKPITGFYLPLSRFTT